MLRCHAELIGAPYGEKIGELIVDGKLFLSSKPYGAEEVTAHPGYGVRAVYTVTAGGRDFLVVPLDAGDVDDPSLLFRKEAPCPE
jgi:hypothetical protein